MSSAIPLSSAEIVKIYTADLLLGRNPAKALKRLYTVGLTMKPFVDAGTEQLLSKYDGDSACRQPLRMLREKFADLKRREAEEHIFDTKIMTEKKMAEGSMSQESANSLFSSAVQKVSRMKTQVSRLDYSKFKIVKRSKKAPKMRIETPKRRSDKSKIRSFSFSSSVYSWSSESEKSTEPSPQY